MCRRLLLLSVPILVLVCAAEEPKPDPKPEAKDLAGAMALLERLEKMEKRIQQLELSAVEKDTRIAELTKKLQEQQALREAQPDQAPQPQQPDAQAPGFGQFNIPLTPEQAQELNKRLDEYFKRHFADDPFADDEPWPRRDPMHDELQHMMDQMARRGRPALAQRKPRLGVNLAPVTADLNARYRNKAETGAFITEVVPDSPADKSGLAAGDCVTAFGEQPVKDVQALISTIERAPAGKTRVTVLRRGEAVSVEVDLARAEAPPARPDLREDQGWLRQDNADTRRQEITEVRSGALELTRDLAAQMKLDEPAKRKMSTALAAHTKKLAEEYSAQIEQRQRDGRRAPADEDLQALAESHALQAEKELRDTLTPEQMELWRKHRAKHGREVSVFRRIQEERREPGELNF